jgi:hypothetical protein
MVVPKPQSIAEKTTKTTVDTIIVTKKIALSWQTPPFQRPLRINEKVKALAEEIKRNGGVIPGVLTIGVLSNESYRLDGQHRIEAFLMSGVEEGYADIRTLFCHDMGQMGEEFVKLNSQLVRMRPDDILRGLEGAYPALSLIREKCRFVGYDMIRRGEKAPLVSMSAVLRIWRGSHQDVPATPSVAAASLATTFTEEEADQLCAFLNVCYEAWGRDNENSRLWGALNLVICAWLYRRTVIFQHSPKTPRLTKDLFKKCLMSLSADTHYVDWLLGRHLGERDRSPAYDRIKHLFTIRLANEMGVKPKLPAPAWSNS